jgi:predicted ATPase/DNA-binding SARP family transcriptional activator/DNA-binding CsgD family transcriptional regulator
VAAKRSTGQRRLGSEGIPAGIPDAVRARLLGGFELSVGPRIIKEGEWPLRKAANLVKLLALAQGHSLHREQATDLLWPELDAQAAANNLHHALHVARRTLEPSSPPGAASSYLLIRDERLALCPDGPLWVDVEAFEEAATTARHAREAAAYRAVLDLYSGELLPQDRYEPWAEQRRAELRELYLSLLVELAELYEEHGEHGPAIEAFSGVVAEEPAREGAHAGLMRLYALSGRRRKALGQYERLREVLFKELGAEPEASSTLLQQEIWTGSFPSTPSPPHAASTMEESPSAEEAAGHNLPLTRTSFVGREREAREVRRLLAMTDLLTLTGAGGSGKTRLALEVVRGLASAYPDGAWLVELAPLSEASLVPQAVAGALGLREMPGRSLEDTLTEHLRRKNLLLVLDNCEHLVGAVAHLAEVLLRSCSKLRIMATSREPLGVGGEAIWTVPSLSLPDTERLSSIEGVAGAEAARLFADRARLRLPDFQLTQENAGAVGRICRKLDGLPLAIELAAARMGALAVEQVAGRLDDSLKLLTGGDRTVEPRQQTLRATLDWSHDLLSERERILFRRLSVFAGGWTLDAAEEVCSGDDIERDEVLDPLSGLVDKSLVVAEVRAESESRYRMLEPVRQYGQERLEGSGEAEQVRERHAEYYLTLAEEADRVHAAPTELREGRPPEWIERMEAELDNLRAALLWALGANAAPDSPRAEVGLRLAVALYWFWATHDNHLEGRRILERAVSRRSSNPTTTRLRARALSIAGWLALFTGDIETSMVLMEEQLALYRELGDREGIASGLTDLASAALVARRDDMPLAEMREELAELTAQLENRNTRGYWLAFEGLVALARGDTERSAELNGESLALFREIRDTQGIFNGLGNLGCTALVRGDYEEAGRLVRESLRLSWEAGAVMFAQLNLVWLASVAAGTGHPVRAARLWGVEEGMHEDYGWQITPLARSITNVEGQIAAARSRVDVDTWARAWAEGKAMPLERAVEYALSQDEADDPPAPAAPPHEQPRAHEPTERLTPREQEVALLVGRGLTNRQIASELLISESTVQNHVHKILKKLGFASRARIAAWAAQQW